MIQENDPLESIKSICRHSSKVSEFLTGMASNIRKNDLEKLQNCWNVLDKMNSKYSKICDLCLENSDKISKYQNKLMES